MPQPRALALLPGPTRGLLCDGHWPTICVPMEHKSSVAELNVGREANCRGSRVWSNPASCCRGSSAAPLHTYSDRSDRARISPAGSQAPWTNAVAGYSC